MYAALPLLDCETIDVDEAVYRLNGLSFREYLVKWSYGRLTPNPIGMEDLLKGHERLCRELRHDVLFALKENINDIFSEYLDSGYYPSVEDNLTLAEENARLVMECDIPALEGMSAASVRKLVKLFGIVARRAPFKPIVSDLADAIGATRAQTLRMLHLLEKVGLIRLLKRPEAGSGGKLEMVYLANNDLLYVFGNVNTWTECSAFFVSQVGAVASLSRQGRGADFIVDGKWPVVLGSRRSLTLKQRNAIPRDSFFVTAPRLANLSDEIPLWLFGFLY